MQMWGSWSMYPPPGYGHSDESLPLTGLDGAEVIRLLLDFAGLSEAEMASGGLRTRAQNGLIKVDSPCNAARCNFLSTIP